jgi:ribosome recycling factor
MDPVLNDTDTKIQNALGHFQRELSAIRAGRANPSLLEEISIMAYGSRMKLMEVGTITSPQPTLLTVQVWDAGLVNDVQKAIQEANLGLTTSNDGNVVRVPIPPLSEERREEFVKLARSKGEGTKVELRQIRGETRDDWKKQDESGEISEDEFHRREKLLQDLIDRTSAKIDELVKSKEEELRQV